MSSKRKRNSSKSPQKVKKKAFKKQRLVSLHADCLGNAKSVALFEEKLEHEENIDDDGNMLLAETVRQRHGECVSKVLARGVSPNCRDENGHSMLYLTSFGPNFGGLSVDINILERLCIAGVNLDERFSQFPIHVLLAVDGLQYYNTVEFLLAHGASPNGLGLSPSGENLVSFLTLITLCADPAYVKLFLEYGADPDGLSFKQRGNGVQLRAVFPPICSVALLCKLRKLKYLLMFNASTKIENLSDAFITISIVSIVLYSERTTLQKKIKALKMLRKFGCNMWPLQNHPHLIQDNDEFDLTRLYKEPLSLLEISRVALLHSMGNRYLKNIHSFEIPSSLYSFLEFSDVDDVEEDAPRGR